ncbi:type II secretion system F family protein [Microvirga aerophila]|uniref:Type II secretion system protein GspF n=1 Tax=Microvirga aerophila TaxID=670291 RepID=A0A512C0H0_9HYPH|nr:type II secretion system F family protein [Microvirga aerophila]GEO17702.1 type II secretion system protein GspF [Microvirga aerophila]
MKFRFEAFDGAGNLIQGEIEASTAKEAEDLVRLRGITPFQVQSAGMGDFLLRDIHFDLGRQVPDASFARFSRDLAVLLQADVPLDASLRIASATAEDRRMRDLALRLLDGVLEGAALADVMNGMKGVFRPEYVKIIQAGDISANLGRAMQELADLLDRRVEIRGKIRASMAYPTLLVVLAIVSLCIVLGLLVPAVTPIFLENGMPLPGPLAVMASIRGQASSVLSFATVLLAGVVLAVTAACRKDATRVLVDKVYLSLPLIGRISELQEAARFTRTLATLIRAGVPPLQALQSSCPLVRNRHIRGLLERTVTDIRAGVSIGGALARSSALPTVVHQMIAVGEETGRLQDMLLRAASILERQEQTRTTQILSVLTPAITILVSGMIGVIILSVMSAILSINDLALL